MGGMSPKKMQAMMKQLGMAQEEIDAERVVIEKSDGSKIIISEPNVSKIKMQGQENFQITGLVSEEAGEVGISEEDIQTIIDKTGATEEAAREKLEEVGDLAEAILALSE